MTCDWVHLEKGKWNFLFLEYKLSFYLGIYFNKCSFNFLFFGKIFIAIHVKFLKHEIISIIRILFPFQEFEMLLLQKFVPHSQYCFYLAFYLS